MVARREALRPETGTTPLRLGPASAGPSLAAPPPKRRGDYVRLITRFRISLMSSIAKRMPSRPSPESFTPP